MADAPALLTRPTAPAQATRHAALHRDAARAKKPVARARRPQALGIDVARQIQALILDGTLRAGERLNEVALARSLGVSRGPVREAARSLEKTGLVTVIMNRGAFVRTLSLDEAMEIYEINAALFGLAAARAAIALVPSEGLVLRMMVGAMDGAIGRGSRDDFFQINSDFHAFILACGRNREAAALYRQLTHKLMLLRRRSFERPGHMQTANREHRGLMEAILRGEAAPARKLAEAHAQRGRARFLHAIGHAAPDGANTEETP
jgi:DNA-binding GntR family transcriptional regulator